jgi:hypothetical protein
MEGFGAAADEDDEDDEEDEDGADGSGGAPAPSRRRFCGGCVSAKYFD